MEAPKTAVNGGYEPPESMIFYVSRNLRDEPLPQLLAALETRRHAVGEADWRRTARTLLQDALYTDGFAARWRRRASGER